MKRKNVDKNVKKKMTGRKKAAICVLSAFVLISSAFVVQHFVNLKPDNSVDKEEKKDDEKDDEEEEKTYSSEYVAELDSLAKSITANMKGNISGDYCYKEGSVLSSYKIDDNNAYDKCTGKYESNLNKNKVVFDRKKEEADDESVLSGLISSEKNGKPVKLHDGIYLYSSYDAIDKSNLEPCDIAYYYRDDGLTDVYIKMENFSKKYEDAVIKHMKKKKTVSIEKTITMRFGNENCNSQVLLSHDKIEYNNDLKIVSSQDGDDLSDSYQNMSKSDCFSFLYDYMNNEGIELNLVSNKPRTNWIYDRRYDFENKQQILDNLNNCISNPNIEKKLDSSCYFDFSYDFDMMSLATISAKSDYKLKNGNTMCVIITYLLDFGD